MMGPKWKYPGISRKVVDLKPESPPGSEFRAGALTFAYLFDTLVMGQGGQGGQGGHRLENTTRGWNVAMSQGSL